MLTLHLQDWSFFMTSITPTIMQRNYSWDTYSHLAGQQIPAPLKTPVLHYQIHKDKINPVHTLTFSSLGISQICHDLPNNLCPSGFTITIMSFISTYLTLLYFITFRIFGEKYILWRFTLCSFSISCSLHYLKFKYSIHFWNMNYQCYVLSYLCSTSAIFLLLF